ncbi:MAG: YchJ family metal-binding protein [Gammaproteobacteria bacterium]|jgi:SEC-C motif domain protein
MSSCPCASGLDYESCCGRFIDGGEKPETAGQLMRSRYTAFTLNDVRYLEKTWHASTRPASIETDDKVRWLGLKIRRVEKGGVDDDDGIVEFVARYKIDGRGHRLHEISRFVKKNGQWLYIDGELLPG